MNLSARVEIFEIFIYLISACSEGHGTQVPITKSRTYQPSKFRY